MKRKISCLLLASLLLLSACGGRTLSAESSSAAELQSSLPEEEASESSFEEVLASAEPEAVSAPDAENSSEAAESSLLPEESASAASTDAVVMPDDWRLILVNPWHMLTEELDVDLVLPPSGRNPDRHKVDARIVEDLEDMIASAAADGVSLLIDYGYRTFAQSEALFEKQINRQLAAHPSYTREEAEEAAKAWVAPPGTSDHHTGLALDIVTPDYQMLDDGFAETPAGKWMAAHSWEYGFVIRFPADKTDITGIAYESWHLRYVGRDHAAVMQEKNLCLEEYVEALAKQN